MTKLKKGKEEIIYLLTKVKEKYQLDTGIEIVQNTNRKNYEGLARLLSEISNQLPYTFDSLGHEHYSPDNNRNAPEYPFRKYDITGGQIKDAVSGIVTNPRPFLVDACYIYLYGVGRKRFEENPLDNNLIATSEAENISQISIDNKSISQDQRILSLQKENENKSDRIKLLMSVSGIFFFLLILFSFLYYNSNKKWKEIRADMNIMPYQPTKSEIDSLEGIWLCYTGSPQARITYADRYHKAVLNVVEFKYKDGYFIYNRYGASFDHIGYAQFESKNVLSIYSRIKTPFDNTESPRHSLMNLNSNKDYISAISASWNFDVGINNKIIGIREIYVKQGKGGTIQEVFNEIENSSCQCKIIEWHQTDNKVKTFYLKNELLDTFEFKEIRPLLDENSILFKEPEEKTILLKDSSKVNH